MSVGDTVFSLSTDVKFILQFRPKETGENSRKLISKYLFIQY